MCCAGAMHVYTLVLSTAGKRSADTATRYSVLSLASVLLNGMCMLLLLDSLDGLYFLYCSWGQRRRSSRLFWLPEGIFCCLYWKMAFDKLLSIVWILLEVELAVLPNDFVLDWDMLNQLCCSYVRWHNFVACYFFGTIILLLFWW